MTGPDVIVNDVFVDPLDSNHVLLATDRGGVLRSRDGAASFTPSNEGFSERKVEALLVDQANPERFYAGVVNDKSYGGVFVSKDSGRQWEQIADGLEERDVYALAQSPEGIVLAGTNHGIFALEAGAEEAPSLRWLPRNTIQNTLVKTAVEIHYGKRVNVEKQVKETARQLSGRVQALDLTGDAWLASTTEGLFTSIDKGANWQGGPVMGAVDFLSVAAHGAMLAATRADEVALSLDAGHSWDLMNIPAMLTRIHSVAFSKDGSVWLGAREGVYFSRDLGKTWMWVNRFPLNDVDSLSFDAHLGMVLVSARSSDQIYLIDPRTIQWTWVQTGYRIAMARATGGRLVAASLYDGVLIEPQAEKREAWEK